MKGSPGSSRGRGAGASTQRWVWGGLCKTPPHSTYPDLYPGHKEPSSTFDLFLLTNRYVFAAAEQRGKYNVYRHRRYENKTPIPQVLLVSLTAARCHPPPPSGPPGTGCEPSKLCASNAKTKNIRFSLFFSPLFLSCFLSLVLARCLSSPRTGKSILERHDRPLPRT